MVHITLLQSECSNQSPQLIGDFTKEFLSSVKYTGYAKGCILVPTPSTDGAVMESNILKLLNDAANEDSQHMDKQNRKMSTAPEYFSSTAKC